MNKGKFLMIVMLGLIGLSGNAQTQIWGTAAMGGINHHGTIFTIDPVDDNILPVYSFETKREGGPVYGLVLANNGKLYGITNCGCGNDTFTVYSYDPASGIHNVIHTFAGQDTNGYSPSCGMTLASDGNLYGVCHNGGPNTNGVLYRINTSTDTYAAIYDFDISTGSWPVSALTNASNNKLYGMTSYGGANNFGGIYSFDITNNIFDTLYSFSDTTGGYPGIGGLLKASDGKYYGVVTGGYYWGGVLFSFDDSTNAYTVVYYFEDLYGWYPTDVIQANNGLLYGTDGTGCTQDFGALFSYDINDSLYSNIFCFNDLDGRYPSHSFLDANNGFLFSTTNNGGTTNAGTIFKYDIDSNTFTLVSNMDTSTIGGVPNCDLIQTHVLTTNTPSIINYATISLSPNPFTTTTTLTLQGTYHNPSLFIYNLLGQEVRSIPIGTNTQVTINREHLASGMYFYKVLDENKEVIGIRKMVVE